LLLSPDNTGNDAVKFIDRNDKGDSTMKLVSILDQDLIICGLAGGTREEQYGNLLDHILKNNEIKSDRQTLLQDITAREDAIPLPYDGVALPHTRTDASPDLTIAIGIPAAPAMLKGNDISPTEIIIMSLIGPSTSDLYLKALAAFSRYLIKKENRQKIVSAASPEAIMATLEDDHVMLKNEITAEDIMNTNCSPLNVDSPISAALDAFTRLSIDQLPVIDDNGKLVGVIDSKEIIKRHIPSYIFMMDNLKFLTTFEPFDKIFKEEQHLCVRNFMLPPPMIIAPDLPLIQITISLIKGEAQHLYVIAPDNRLLGVVGIQQLVHKVLRG